MSDQREITIPCEACGRPLGRVETFAEGRTTFDVYQCAESPCARKAVVIYEPPGGLLDEEVTFIEREIARHGAFFPGDYTGGHRFDRFRR